MNGPTDGVLIDIAGVVHQSGVALEGSADALRRLRAAGVPFTLLTNTTSKPLRAVVEMLFGMGVEVSPADVMTAPTATADYLRRHALRPMLIATPVLEEDFAGLDRSDPNCVVVGDAGAGFTYDVLNRAFRLLHADAEAPLLAMGGNRYYRDADGGLSLDIYPFVALLADASGREPIVLGKPAAEFFHTAVASLGDGGVSPDRVVMIGDDLQNDVVGALDAGLRGVLVRTGKFDQRVLADSEVAPTAVVENLAAAIDAILGGGPEA